MDRKCAIYLSRDTAGKQQTRRDFGRRILLYSHDSYGLGHLRRNLTIAEALISHDPGSSAIILTGSPCATQFPAPERCEILKIPAIGKDQHGAYVPRFLDASLDEVIALRRQLIFDTYEAFDPDLLIVDHQPVGLMGEMLDTLKHASESGKPAIFGMRDIVDSRQAVERTWCPRECLLALRSYYRKLLVYGDKKFFDPLIEYPVLKELEYKLDNIGYVARPNLGKRASSPDREPAVLVTVGGGDDGARRIRTYLDALQLAPPRWYSRIVTGPLMPGDAINEFKLRARRNRWADKVKIYRFHGDISGLLRQSDAVVSMAGYNSCVEILQSGTPAVFMPREQMRQEQTLRADRMAARGLARVVATGDAHGLRTAVEEALASKRPVRHELDMNGLDRLCAQVDSLIGRSAAKNADRA